MASTVEWTALAMVLGAGGIAGWRNFGGQVAATVARGGDCIVALDASCAGAPRQTREAGPDLTPSNAPPLFGPIGSSGLQWGAPGFTQGWTPQQRADHLREHGVADPNADYWTPFWSSDRHSVYTGVPDTGPRNAYAVIHDYNLATRDWPWFLDYFDVVTPLSGFTHRDIDRAIVEARRRWWKKMLGG